MAIIGWVTVVAGLSLATGMTVGRLASGTKRAAGAVRETAERSRTMVKNRGEEEPGLAGSGFFWRRPDHALARVDAGVRGVRSHGWGLSIWSVTASGRRSLPAAAAAEPVRAGVR